MTTIAEILAWFTSHGMAGSQRPEFRSGKPAAFVGKQNTSGEIVVLENPVLIFQVTDGHWRVDRYFFGGRREGVDLQTADEASQVALAVIETGHWPTSVVAREF